MKLHSITRTAVAARFAACRRTQGHATLTVR
jgi:hypothetical protein